MKTTDRKILAAFFVIIVSLIMTTGCSEQKPKKSQVDDIIKEAQTMTLEQLAKKAAESAVSLAKGNSVAGISTMENGDYEVPYLSIAPIMVTKDNIDSVIIDSGFHLREDVYLKER